MKYLIIVSVFLAACGILRARTGLTEDSGDGPIVELNIFAKHNAQRRFIVRAQNDTAGMGGKSPERKQGRTMEHS